LARAAVPAPMTQNLERTPMATHSALPTRRWSIWASGLLLMAAGCVDLPATTQVPVATAPVPTGQARMWFYRPYEPYESLNLANIDMNGSYIGAVANGGAFYRDVPPGRYHIAPQSFGRDFNQDRDVDVAPGQNLYIKIVSLESWGVSVSGSRNLQRDTFYAWLIPPEVAQAELARDRGGI
jgi:Protein of unknown function (DUF2846)